MTGMNTLQEPEALRSNNRTAVVTWCVVIACPGLDPGCMEHRWMTLYPSLRYGAARLACAPHRRDARGMRVQG